MKSWETLATCSKCGKTKVKRKDELTNSYMCIACFRLERGKSLGHTYGKAQNVQGTCHFCGQPCHFNRQKVLPCCDDAACIEKRLNTIKDRISSRMSGENNPAYSGRKLLCDCGKKLRHGTKHCRACSFKSGARSGPNNGRWKADKSYKVAAALARNLVSNMKKRTGYKKTTKTERVLGYTFEAFKAHIESQFEPWMTWDNHGLGKDKWSIDHIVPVAVLIDHGINDPAIINALWNLRPLDSIDNIRKSASLTEESIRVAKEKVGLDLSQY